jgi:hypothetical protein
MRSPVSIRAMARPLSIAKYLSRKNLRYIGVQFGIKAHDLAHAVDQAQKDRRGLRKTAQADRGGELRVRVGGAPVCLRFLSCDAPVDEASIY